MWRTSPALAGRRPFHRAFRGEGSHSTCRDFTPPALDRSPFDALSAADAEHQSADPPTMVGACGYDVARRIDSRFFSRDDPSAPSHSHRLHGRPRRHARRYAGRFRRGAQPRDGRHGAAAGRARFRRAHHRSGQRAPDPQRARRGRRAAGALRGSLDPLPAPLRGAQRAARRRVPRRGGGTRGAARARPADGLPDQQAGRLRARAAPAQGPGRLLRPRLRRRRLRAQEARSAAAAQDLRGDGHQRRRRPG